MIGPTTSGVEDQEFRKRFSKLQRITVAPATKRSDSLLLMFSVMLDRPPQDTIKDHPGVTPIFTDIFRHFPLSWNGPNWSKYSKY